MRHGGPVLSCDSSPPFSLSVINYCGPLLSHLTILPSFTFHHLFYFFLPSFLSHCRSTDISFDPFLAFTTIAYWSDQVLLLVSILYNAQLSYYFSLLALPVLVSPWTLKYKPLYGDLLALCQYISFGHKSFARYRRSNGGPAKAGKLVVHIAAVYRSLPLH